MTKAPFTVAPYDVAEVLEQLHHEVKHPRVEERRQTLPRFMIRLYWKWKVTARSVKAWLRRTLGLSARK